MKRSIDVTALVVVIASAGSALAAGAPDPHRAMLTTYCVTCHNTRAKIGGLALDGLDLQAAPDDAQIWEKALRKLRGHLMPPPGSPQPPQKDVDSFVAWMENTLDSHAKGPKAGYVPIQRLNRTEYAASVKALVGVDVNREGRSAAGHPGGRLRQHRGRFERVPRVPRSVRHRGAARREARGRQSQSSRFEREVLHRRQPESATSRCLPARAAA